MKNYKVVSTQPTPNPDALKFVVDQTIVFNGTITFDDRFDAEGDAFAEAMFGLPGILTVYINKNFVTVTKSVAENWSDLKAEVHKIIESHLSFYESAEDSADKVGSGQVSVLEEVTPEMFQKLTDGEKALVIDALFDEQIRPALAADGGGLTVESVEGKKLRIHYEGACGSCPSSASGTLRAIQGIVNRALDPEMEVFTS